MTDKTSNSCFLVLFPPPVFLSLPPVSLLEEALRQWKQLGRWWRILEPFPRWSRQSQPINRLRPPQLSRDTWKVLPLDTAPHFNIDFIIDNLANINVDISRYQNQQPQPTFSFFVRLSLIACTTLTSFPCSGIFLYIWFFSWKAFWICSLWTIA